MGGIALTVIIGVATGLAASALFWWLQAKLLRPKIIICPDLRLVEVQQDSSETRREYEFIVVNSGRFAAADISIKVKFSVPGFLSERGVFDFYMRDLAVSWMEPRTDDKYLVGPNHLLLDEEQKEYCIRLEKKLGRSLQQLGMRDLVEAYNGSYVTVFVASNHAFSGARAFKRAIFTNEDFISANIACERPECCQNNEVRWLNLSGLANILKAAVSLKS